MIGSRAKIFACTRARDVISFQARRLVQPLVYEHADFGKVDPVAMIDRLVMLSDMRMDPSAALSAEEVVNTWRVAAAWRGCSCQRARPHPPLS